jgi:hypothetical protein
MHRRETENGLAALGLRLEVRHATTPRAKPIEGLLHIIQDRMRCIQNFVGFNERTEKFERVQALLSRARRGDPEALAQFPSAEEWMTKIRCLLWEFAHDPQNGKMLGGLSPAEAWAEHVRHQPLRKLADEDRYIFATHPKRVFVRQEGISLTIRGKKYLYYNEHTGPRIGREVLAFYNIEMPELLTVTDLNRQNWFSVKRVELPAMSATKEELAEVNRLSKAHMAHAKAIFGGLKHEVVSTITRDNELGPEEKELGRFHNEEAEKANTEKSAITRKLHKIQTEAARAGVELSDRTIARIKGGDGREADEALDAAQKLNIYRAQMEAEIQKENQKSQL